MENEIKEEKVECKKKGNGLFTLFACVMTGVIVFLATNLGYKASKVVDPDTSNSTSNVESNTTVETKLSETEALEIGKTLYTKAISVYPENGLMVENTCTSINGATYDCTALYNKVKEIFATENSVTEDTIYDPASAKDFKNIFTFFTLKDGKYIAKEGGQGSVCRSVTTLSVKSIEENKIEFIATKNQIEANKATKKHEFEIVKENGTWKISKYIYVLCSDEVQ